MASQSPVPSRHLTLPFNLLTDPEAFYNPENRDLPTNLFPGNYGLSTDGIFLYFLQTEMPPKPCLKSVAGLPPYFAPRMGPQYMPRPFGEFILMRNGEIAKGLDERDMVDWNRFLVLLGNIFKR